MCYKAHKIVSENKIIMFAFLIIVFFHTNILHAATYSIPISAESIFVIDKDLDGDLDIVVGHKTAWGQTNPTISILENDGKGVFPCIDTSHVFCGYQENIILQKIDDDEYPDIITFYSDSSSGSAERYIRIIDNNNGEFGTYQDFSLNSDRIFSGINSGDIDGDGDIDIVFYSNSSYFWGYMKNDGTGQFSSPVYRYYEVPLGSIACGDLNNDEIDEVIVSCSPDKLLVYSSGLLIDEITYNTDCSEIWVRDINRDGKNEIIVAGGVIGAYTELLVFSKNDTGSFELSYSKRINEAMTRLSIADLNGDEYPDIVYNCSYYYPNSDYEKWHTYIMYNENGVSFADPVNYQTYFGDTPNYTSSIRSFVADIDGNGLNDIVVLNSGQDSDVTILFQTEEGNFVQEPQSGIEDRDNLVSKTELSQNYPNPFNNETKIQFSLDLPSEVELSVYNGKGELVENLVKGRYDRGAHSANYRADDLTSGVYYYELKVNGIQRQVRKMLYLR